MIAEEQLGGAGEHLHPGQFVVGQEWSSPGGSAYGTAHPIDKALGRVRRIRSYKATLGSRHTGTSTSEALHAARDVLHAGASAATMGTAGSGVI